MGRKDICEEPPEIIVPQHPDCNPEFEECAHDNRILIDLVSGECIKRDADPHFTKGYELYHMGMIDDALVELDASLNVNPNRAEAHLLIGDIYERRRMFDEAISEYKEALRLSPEDGTIKLKLEIALSQRAGGRV
ncbi:tetratricopeptide repeat protein [Methanocella conradii]|uniref:tetratricopeptide repeat protein n=1 Tax=Methanocella conradii TaxID=1175444 RepID=UPI0024B37106|nr:tetratricopeptide repeat protein [Methanocella conradii]MDI6897946.1 tetratricopeptide repeat protein [Methanocella conradii]